MKLQSNLIKLVIAAAMISIPSVPALALDRALHTDNYWAANGPNGAQSGDHSQDGGDDGQQSPGDGVCD